MVTRPSFDIFRAIHLAPQPGVVLDGSNSGGARQPVDHRVVVGVVAIRLLDHRLQRAAIVSAAVGLSTIPRER